jgi:hypothetical protein
MWERMHNTITRSALLASSLSFAAFALPACAVDATTATEPSAAPAERTGHVNSEMDIHCLADMVPTTGTMGCFQPPYPHVPEQLTEFVSGYSDASYASTCPKQATFNAPIPKCGDSPGWSQNLSYNVLSYLSSTKLPASVCTASYLDYTLWVELSGTYWSSKTGRVYGTYNQGYCFLGYDGEIFDEGNVTDIEISADSYEVENFSVPNLPPVIITTPQGVSFGVGPDGDAQ